MNTTDRTTRFGWRRLLALVFVLAMTAAACGNDDDGGAITPADPTDGTPTTAPTDDTDDGETDDGTSDGASELVIAAMDIAFDQDHLEASAGDIEVTFENNDDGIPHNFHVGGPGEDFATEITEGPVTQTLSFTITEPGLYLYMCEVHPSQMRGELVVD